MSERETWINLIRNEYDPSPSHYKMGDDWDDSAGRIADAILADQTLRLREAVAIERKRCSDIVGLARFGEMDGDFRTIIHMIESGYTVEKIKAL